MDISITAVTRNRSLSKGIVRLSEKLDSIREVAGDIATDDEDFDTLQLVLTDDPAGFLDVEPPRRGDRLLQVRVGASEFPTSGPGDDHDMLERIKNALRNALDAAGIGASKAEAIKGRI